MAPEHLIRVGGRVGHLRRHIRAAGRQQLTALVRVQTCDVCCESEKKTSYVGHIKFEKRAVLYKTLPAVGASQQKTGSAPFCAGKSDSFGPERREITYVLGLRVFTSRYCSQNIHVLCLTVSFICSFKLSIRR